MPMIDFVQTMSDWAVKTEPNGFINLSKNFSDSREMSVIFDESQGTERDIAENIQYISDYLKNNAQTIVDYLNIYNTTGICGIPHSSVRDINVVLYQKYQDDNPQLNDTNNFNFVNWASKETAKLAIDMNELYVPETETVQSIPFSRKFVGKPFYDENGDVKVRVMVPNEDPADKRRWETFKVSAEYVCRDKDGNRYLNMPNIDVELERSSPAGVNGAGKVFYSAETRTVSAQKLCEIYEKGQDNYISRKDKEKGSVREALQNHKNNQYSKSTQKRNIEFER